jgi:hypothetical protein
MSVVKIRNDADDGWIVVGGGVSVVQQAGAPASTYPGMLWVDTDADNPGNSIIEDADNDTKIQCEETADEDIIRMDCAGTEVWNMSAAGERTMTKQPAFLTLLSGTQSNLGVGTLQAVQFDTEVFDQGSDFNTGTYTFTAPVTGRYRLDVLVYFGYVDKDHDYLQVILTTSNANRYMFTIDPGVLASDPVYWGQGASLLCDMDANDTAKVDALMAGGVAQTDIFSVSYFAGNLVA